MQSGGRKNVMVKRSLVMRDHLRDLFDFKISFDYMRCHAQFLSTKNLS